MTETLLETLPTFELKNQNDELVKSSDLAGKSVLLYFYPKDSTPGCTIQANDFSKFKSNFNTQDIIIYGVSKDSVKSHDKFCNKYDLTIDLLSDPDQVLIDACGVWQEKKFMGRTFMGIVRSTFLFDASGKLIKHWDKVKAKGHAEAVLEALNDL